MTRKMFVPKPFEPGSVVTWKHHHHGGAVSEVEGVVICGAPNISNNRTMWVQPTTPGFNEIYSMVPVVRVGRERFYFSIPLASGGGSGVKGELVSSGVMGTESYWMMRSAWERGQEIKSQSINESEMAVAA